MTDDPLPETDESADTSRYSRRTALGTIGAGVFGTSTLSTVSANDDDDGNGNDGEGARGGRREANVVGPDPADYVDAHGEPLEDPDEATELFDPEPEFPPYVNYEAMLEEHREDAERYLEPHGTPSLLDSRRLIVDPGGDPMTWGDFETPTGTATITTRGQDDDQNQRATVEVELDGLVPDGVYTVWAVHRPTWHRPLGGNDGDENVFHADEDGTGSLRVVDEPAELTLPPGATADEEEGVDPIPITDEPLDIVEEFVFVGAYHYDDRTWDSQPGPFFVPQFRIPVGMDD